MSVKNYYDQLNSQTGIKAYIKKRIFNHLLGDLVEQETEIERIKKSVARTKAELSKKMTEHDDWMFRELLKIGNPESRNLLLSDRYYQLTGELLDLNDHGGKADRVLLVEFNNWHGECIPGFYKYLTELKYDVDYLVSDKVYQENALAAINYKTAYHCNIELMALLLHYVLIERYKYVIFNSNAFLWPERKRGKWYTVLQEFPFLYGYLDKIYVLEHQMEYLDKTLAEMGHVFVLTDKLPLDKRLIPVNCHWFGERFLPPKNKVTRFITVGTIAAYRKNFKLLLETIEYLCDRGMTDFHVTVVGLGALDNINAKIRPFISVLGRVSYSDVCSEMKKSDFFLTLLDPDNPEHDRYITIGTSGSFQLIYGFSKPCLIAEKFADVYGFSSENAVVYKENSELCAAMLKAIEMKEDEYENIRNNLIKFSDDIYNRSLENLKKALAGAEGDGV